MNVAPAYNVNEAQTFSKFEMDITVKLKLCRLNTSITICKLTCTSL